MNTKDSVFPCKCGRILLSFRSYSSHLPYCEANNNVNSTVVSAQPPSLYPAREDSAPSETRNEGPEGLEKQGQKELATARNTGILNLFEMSMERYKSCDVDSEPEQMGVQGDTFPDPESQTVPQDDTIPDNSDKWVSNIMNPSTVSLPDVIEKEMFKPPPNFNKKYLHTQVLKRKQSDSGATWQIGCHLRRKQI